MKDEVNASMKIKAYRLYEHAVALQPAPPVRMGDRENAGIYAGVPVTGAGGPGWHLLCPVAFEATWNGGPRPEDIGIRWYGVGADLPDFVTSQLGEGRLTFYPGYQFKTEDGYVLWVRGPVNAPKDGIAALEQILDTSLLPCTVTVQWQFTRPGQTIRFEAGEPFGLLLPYAPAGQADAALEVIRPQDDVAAYEEAVQQMLTEPALQEVLMRLGAAPAEPTPPAAAGSSESKRAPSAWAAQLCNPPPVSCICPTYGRVALLEEAIYSFLQQDYAGQKELIVLNDYAGQTLAFDHPEVRIVNLPQRFNSVGEKYIAAAALASHDLIFVWHDDDIYLPHRLSYAVAHLDQNTAFFKADRAWFWNDGKLSGPERNVFHGGSCWRRDLLSRVHGYPPIGNRYDVEFERLCQAEAPGALRVDSIKPEDIYYIYRWGGTGSYHLSAMGADGQEHQKVAAYVEQQAARGQIPQGDIRLQPRWKADYHALVQNRLATLAAAKDVPQTTHLPPASFIDTPNGRVEFDYEPGFFIRERFFGTPREDLLRRYGEIYGRDFYIIDALKLVYLSIPKVACTAIKLTLGKAIGIDFEPSEDRELAIHHHPKWGWAQDHLTKTQDGYYRFTFVRNPFDRLVSCYRQKIISTPMAERQAPLFHNYFFAMPANISFADFVERVCRIPDALADSHFKSQYALVYRKKELQVDYVGKFEQLDLDWEPIAEKYQFEPLLVHANVSKNKPGCHSDYRLYYTEPLVQLVYERYHKDVHTFGYEEEYEQLLAFVRQHQPTAAPGMMGNLHEKELSRYER